MTKTQTTTTNHFVRALVLLLALVLAAGTLSQGAGPAKAAYPGTNGKIAFESERTTGRGVDNPTGDSEIFIMNPDGTGVRQLTKNTVTDITPTIAPDGFSWAHERIQNGNREIIYHAGAFEANITNNPANDRYPVFSPDSSRIAFMSD